MSERLATRARAQSAWYFSGWRSWKAFMSPSPMRVRVCYCGINYPQSAERKLNPPFRAVLRGEENHEDSAVLHRIKAGSR